MSNIVEMSVRREIESVFTTAYELKFSTRRLFLRSLIITVAGTVNLSLELLCSFKLADHRHHTTTVQNA